MAVPLVQIQKDFPFNKIFIKSNHKYINPKFHKYLEEQDPELEIELSRQIRRTSILIKNFLDTNVQEEQKYKEWKKYDYLKLMLNNFGLHFYKIQNQKFYNYKAFKTPSNHGQALYSEGILMANSNKNQESQPKEILKLLQKVPFEKNISDVGVSELIKTPQNNQLLLSYNNELFQQILDNDRLKGGISYFELLDEGNTEHLKIKYKLNLFQNKKSFKNTVKFPEKLQHLLLQKKQMEQDVEASENLQSSEYITVFIFSESSHYDIFTSSDESQDSNKSVQHQDYVRSSDNSCQEEYQQQQQPQKTYSNHMKSNNDLSRKEYERNHGENLKIFNKKYAYKSDIVDVVEIQFVYILYCYSNVPCYMDKEKYIQMMEFQHQNEIEEKEKQLIQQQNELKNKENQMKISFRIQELFFQNQLDGIDEQCKNSLINEQNYGKFIEQVKQQPILEIDPIVQNLLQSQQQ